MYRSMNRKQTAAMCCQMLTFRAFPPAKAFDLICMRLAMLRC